MPNRARPDNNLSPIFTLRGRIDVIGVTPLCVTFYNVSGNNVAELWCLAWAIHCVLFMFPSTVDLNEMHVTAAGAFLY